MPGAGNIRLQRLAVILNPVIELIAVPSVLFDKMKVSESWKS